MSRVQLPRTTPLTEKLTVEAKEGNPDTEAVIADPDWTAFGVRHV
jgi:hypothetical protein